ncbi:hypothetical protein QQS45_04215 [Alteriqipengyuania flavescens]|nr:hypothetical protein [Alteriqipengyuania flavescens]WJY19439.1 hypothetical protein QQW98_04210 [Alteriqipengyuania flavescens]WJY25381.1 hypothetical protein QQS45_04215 [Alteriqipengyuania flavescens]
MSDDFETAEYYSRTRAVMAPFLGLGGAFLAYGMAELASDAA